MLDLTRTTTVLLDGLHDQANVAAWMEFDRRYRPIVIGFARRLGLADPDAADVAQETMARFLEEYRAGRYDRDRGRLRSWIIAIARTRVAGIRRRRATRREARGESAIVDLADEARLTSIWDAERRTRILREALTRLRETTRTDERTIRTFEMHVLNHVPAAAVAAELDIGVQDVYLAKSRVARRLREIVTSLESVYDDAPPVPDP
ncbi:MAG: RNA polymerase sigma factor [Planctomycetota bacterium]